jgi:hypothetical protein
MSVEAPERDSGFSRELNIQYPAVKFNVQMVRFLLLTILKLYVFFGEVLDTPDVPEVEYSRVVTDSIDEGMTQ